MLYQSKDPLLSVYHSGITLVYNPGNCTEKKKKEKKKKRKKNCNILAVSTLDY